MTAEAPPIDRTQLAARLRLAITRLNRRLRQQAGTGLGASAQSALASLVRAGPLSLGDLAAVEGVKPPTMTSTIAALETQGLVVRLADPSDRRVTRVAATQKGRASLQRSASRKTAYLAERLRDLDEEQLRALDGAAALLEHLI